MTTEQQTTQNYFNLQDTFLNYLRRNKVNITVFLANGVKMQGVIVSFDSFSLMLKKDNYFQFVYKHAISTIVPSGKFDMQDLMMGSRSDASCCCSSCDDDEDDE